METDKSGSKILKILIKDFTIKPTITYLAQETGLSRVGIWKVLKKLEKDKLILLSPAGTGRTSVYSISLNWENPLVEKNLSLILTEDAIKQQRWRSNFAELENKVCFLIIYGSIIHSEKQANDVDLLIVTDKKGFRQIDEVLGTIQKTQIKNVHTLNFTHEEFKQELEKPNKAFIDAVKKGVVLFGQEGFIKFIKGVYRK